MRAPKGIVFNLMLGVTAGFILGQLFYLPLADVTDAGYNSAVSWAGAALGGQCFATAAVILNRRPGTEA